MVQKRGVWVKLDGYTRENGPGASRKPWRGGPLRRASRAGWAVLVFGTPVVGEAIQVEKRSGQVGRFFVKAIVVAAERRGDGKSVVVVSPYPVLSVEEVHGMSVEEARATRPPARATTRNPRICEGCEGPCRPGAGMCDQCKAERRGPRVAADGMMLRAGPAPENAV